MTRDNDPFPLSRALDTAGFSPQVKDRLLRSQLALSALKSARAIIRDSSIQDAGVIRSACELMQALGDAQDWREADLVLRSLRQDGEPSADEKEVARWIGVAALIVLAASLAFIFTTTGGQP